MTSRLSVLALAVICLSSTAEASIEVGDAVTLTRGPGSVGGVFYVDDVNDGPGVDFHTFCVEITEHIHLGSKKYYVYDISKQNHRNNGDPVLQLGSFAAWLYTQYLDTSSPNHIAIGSGEHSKANAMQLGIWRSMGYTDALIDPVVNWNLASLTTSFLNGWHTAFTNDLAWQTHGPNYTGSVAIMNLATGLNPDLTPKSNSFAQDQLVWRPAPEPGTLLVWAGLIGAAGAAAIYQRPKA